MDVRRGWLRYLVAAGVTIVMIPVARVMAPLHGYQGPSLASLPLVLPVIFSAWLGGRGPGFFSAVIAASAFAIYEYDETGVTRAGVFFAIASIIIYLSDRLWTVDRRAAELHLQAAKELEARQRVERALEGNEKQLALIASAVPVLIAYIDADRRITFANRAWLEWFGPASGTGVLEAALPAAAARSLAMHAADALEGRRTNFELTIDRQSSGPFDIEGLFVPDAGDDGQPRGFVAMLADVTDRTRVQTGLAVQNRVAQAIAAARTLDQLPHVLEVIAGGLRAESARFWHARDGALQLAAEWPPRAGRGAHEPPALVVEARQRQAAVMTPADLAPVAAAVAVPGAEVDGVIEVSGTRRFTLDGIAREVLQAISVQVGQFIQRAGAEAHAAERARFNTRLVEAIPQIVFTARGDRTLTSLSARWHHVTGLDADQSLGLGWHAAVHADDLPGLHTAWQRAAGRAEPLRHEVRLRLADTRWHWHLIVAIPSRDDAETQWFGTFTDIDDQKRAAESQRILAEVATTLSTALGHEDTTRLIAELPVGRFADIVMVAELTDEGLRWEGVAHIDAAASDRLQRLHDLHDFSTSTAIAAARVTRTGEPELASTPQQIDLDEALRGLNALSAITVPLVARGRTLGAITLACLEGRPYDDGDLHLAMDYARRCAVAIDNARLYQQTEQASRMKDEFLATVSHELRTPLNAMLGWTKLLRSGRLEAERVDTALETIERNTLAQARLIEDLLDVSRIVTGKLRLQKKAVDLADIVRAAIATVQPAADARGVTLDVQIEMPDGSLMGDGARLQQVVWNLLSNAIKFSPEQGRVTVTLTSDGAQAALSVSDRGIGIPQAFLPYVFDRFRQADSTITRSHGGLGVGLAIVRHVVEMHGGMVEAFSEGENRGATFTVRLPLEAATARGARPRVSHEAREEHDIAGVTIVLVDDQPDALEMTRLLLEGRGASVRTAPTARLALQALRDNLPDVLVADIGMPGEDGYWLVEQVRSDAALSAVPAVALTAYARPEDRARALNAGFQAHLTKPLDADALTAEVASLARSPQILRSPHP